jgi:nitrilase
VLAGNLYDKEGILYANLDLSEVIQSKLDFEGVGHYLRHDIFQLVVNENPRFPVVKKKNRKIVFSGFQKIKIKKD